MVPVNASDEFLRTNIGEFPSINLHSMNANLRAFPRSADNYPSVIALASDTNRLLSLVQFLVQVRADRQDDFRQKTLLVTLQILFNSFCMLRVELSLFTLHCRGTTIVLHRVWYRDFGEVLQVCKAANNAKSPEDPALKLTFECQVTRDSSHFISRSENLY